MPFQKGSNCNPKYESVFSLLFKLCNCSPMPNMKDASFSTVASSITIPGFLRHPPRSICVSVHGQTYYGPCVDLCFLGRYVRWKLANCNCTLECLVKLLWIPDVWESSLDGWPDQTFCMLMPGEPKQFADPFQTIARKAV